MKVYGTNVLESLGGELPPTVLLLAAMLENQIESLAVLRTWGLWRSSPEELPDGLRAASAERGDQMHWSQALGHQEWQLWGRATDVLIEALERETPIRIDRGRIAALAAARMRDDGRHRGRAGR